MNANQLIGEYVRLVALNSDRDLDVLARWSALSASWRLLDGEHTRPMPGPGGVQAARPGPSDVGFLVYPLDGRRPIGHAGLFGQGRVPGQVWLGIGLGDAAGWDAPAGVDALRVALRYAFCQLAIDRVLLGVFDYQARALRAFESVGFAIRGRMLQEAGPGGRSRAGVCLELRREIWEQAAWVTR